MEAQAQAHGWDAPVGYGEMVNVGRRSRVVAGLSRVRSDVLAVACVGHNYKAERLILVGNWGLELPVEDVDELLMAADYKALVPLSNLR